jgi:uncharacterized OB-fold protein
VTADDRSAADRPAPDGDGSDPGAHLPVIAERPLPAVDPVSVPFWDGAREGVLRVQRCTGCGAHQWYPRQICVADGGDVEWVDCTGRGTVHTYTVIRQNHAQPFVLQLPYVVAMIDLDEGVRMMANVTHCAPDDVHIGMPVEVWFAPTGSDDDLHLPFWRPVTAP